ncbi:hypothetical protein [Fodinicola acaciae]|uniref:hypothetical protein n=1 Tax=Fodinicola acaciae TaxID=2681555 RepID=UPI0013D6541A|nr:hypothetical protein [Fodinicola acaciae]
MKTAFERLVAARPPAVRDPVDEALLARITAVPSRRAHRPRRLVLAAGFAAVLAIAGTVTAVRLATPAQTAPHTDRMTVVAHIQKAVSEGDYVVRSHSAYSTSDGRRVEATSWSDAVTGVTRTSTTVGGARTDIVTKGGSTTVVSYRDRSWWQLRPAPAPQPTEGIRLDGPPDTTAKIKAALATGMFLVDKGKQQTIRGHRTLQLSSSRPHPVLGSMTIWVDAGSYLPVRIAGNGDAKIRFVGADLDWLPRTAANLANLDPAIPSGFRRVDRPIEPKPPAGGGVG